MAHPDSYKSKTKLNVGGVPYEIFSLANVAKVNPAINKLPFSMKVLLENLLRFEDGRVIKKEHIDAIVNWKAASVPETEISFTVARVLLQDFTGVPAVVDMGAMREAIVEMGGDPKKINPLRPADLVIDHSVQVDKFGTTASFEENVAIEYERNRERYEFLRWGAQALRNFRVVPPGTGICHQVNLEYLAQVVFHDKNSGQAYPDTLVGTDSHTVMVNGLGVVGWGVGGIEAEAALLGQPVTMLIPQVVGFKLINHLPPGATATDLVLTVTEMLRKKGVVGKFVEFYGPGVTALSAYDRATVGNMAPEYGATIGFFPVDSETINYLKMTGRSPEHLALVESYCKEQGLWHTKDMADPVFSDTLELDLSRVVPSIAGPKRPQDRIPLTDSKKSFRKSLLGLLEGKCGQIDQAKVNSWLTDAGKPELPTDGAAHPELGNLARATTLKQGALSYRMGHGAVVIASITSCTNTSNPNVMLAAGILAKKAVEKGLDTKPWVKTSLAPGSQVVTDYLTDAGLMPYLEALGFHLVGYGCTTCIGNSGPLPEYISDAVTKNDLAVAAVLSGNRNFEGRINPFVQMNYLASPPLVVAYAISGEMDHDMSKDPVGYDRMGQPVFLKDIWPSDEEIRLAMAAVKPEQFRKRYSTVVHGDKRWQSLKSATGDTAAWDPKSTYVRKPTFFENIPKEPKALQDIKGARCLAVLGDSITTDHISPAGNISKKSPAAKYLIEHGVPVEEFNSYGSRRGNHEVMVRGTFANTRIKNLMVPGVEGGVTMLHPEGTQLSIYDAAVEYEKKKIPLVVVAGLEYGTGSSRDWAAKGTMLLGVRAVIAKSFERIHRSNLVGMGVLPLQFEQGQDATTLQLTGREMFEITGVAEGLAPGKKLTVKVTGGHGGDKTFSAICRIDTPNELDYYRNGGILQYVLRQLAKA
ncbi:MAG: aconitate hydratase AcnA [Myxococcaceae bacterium]